MEMQGSQESLPIMPKLIAFYPSNSISAEKSRLLNKALSIKRRIIIEEIISFLL